MEFEFNWFRALFNFSEGLNWFVMAYLLIMWRWLTTSFKWLAVVFIHVTLSVALSNSAYIFFDLNNRFISHLRTPIEFILIGMIYYSIIESYAVKKVIISLIILFPIFCIINALYIESFWYSSPTIPSTITNLAVIIYSIYFLYKTFVNSDIKSHIADTDVILVLSLFFFYSSTFVQEMTLNLIGYNKEIKTLYYATICFVWIIHIGGILYSLRMIYNENNSRKRNGLSVKSSDETPF